MTRKQEIIDYLENIPFGEYVPVTYEGQKNGLWKVYQAKDEMDEIVIWGYGYSEENALMDYVENLLLFEPDEHLDMLYALFLIGA